MALMSNNNIQLPTELCWRIQSFNSHPCADIMNVLIDGTDCLIKACPIETDDFHYKTSFPFKLAWGGFLTYRYNKHKHEFHQLSKAGPNFDVRVSRLNLMLDLRR